jgi:hypothetical protein
MVNIGIEKNWASPNETQKWRELRANVYRLGHGFNVVKHLRSNHLVGIERGAKVNVYIKI